ncbi:MAG: CBS domain-containing protein [Actinomycetota bacterium]
MTGTVSDVMTKIVVAAPASAPFRELVRIMHDHRVSALPVLDADGTIVGVVSEADLLLKRDAEVLAWHLFEGRHGRADRRKALGRVASDLMSTPPVTIGPAATPGEAAHRMHEAGVKRLPVVDEDGRVLGVVSRIDLLRAFLRGDEVLTEEVEAFAAQVVPDVEGVRVSAHDGVVRLEGIVELRTTARRLADRVRLLDGVVAVDAQALDWAVDDTVPPVSAVPWAGF